MSPAAGPGIKSGSGTLPTPNSAKFDAKVSSPEVKSLIPIRGGGKSLGHPGGHVDSARYWFDYYKTHDESPDQLRETLRILNASERPQDVYAALSGYLTHRPKRRETWMYEAAAMAVEMNGGTPEEAKKYLGFAADLALQSLNPNDLVSVADKMFLKGWYERIGPLLDQAAAKVPHRSEPLIMSINLAQKTKDPVRMRKAIQGLLSLGWAGTDDYFRREARKQAETLAASLREDGRTKEADDLIASLPDAEARDLFVRLTWSGDAAFDLIVDEPLGAQASQAMPRTVFGGAILNDGNLGHREETYVCPRAFDGEYRISVEETYSDEKKPATRLSLEVITHEGTPQERKQVFPLDPAKPGKPVVVKLEGGRRTTVLPFVNPLAALAPVIDAHEKLREKAAQAKPAAAARARAKDGKPEAPKTARDAIKVER